MSITQSIPVRIDRSFPIDDAAQQTLNAVLASMPEAGAYIDVAVSNGVARLDGTVSDGRWLARLKNKITAALPGVTIDDRVEWVVQDCGVGLA